LIIKNDEATKIIKLIYKNPSVFLENKKNEFFSFIGKKGVEDEYKKTIKINGKLMNNFNLNKLNENEKLNLVEPITIFFYEKGFIYPESDFDLYSDYAKICNKKLDINLLELNNNDNVGTKISKYFCPQYFKTKTRDSISTIEAFENKEIIKKAVEKKLKINKDNYSSLNFTIKSITAEIRDMRLSSSVSVFKPLIAKFICEKYSEVGETVGDYSCGFGGRL
jgi:hypothetical protein